MLEVKNLQVSYGEIQALWGIDFNAKDGDIIGLLGAVAPASHLKPGATYLLQRWNGRWKPVKTFVATKEPPRFTDLPADGLYWLVEKRSRKLERIFTIENGRQRFW